MTVSAQAAPKQWYKLDNAGKLYPAVATPKWNCVFRLSAVLHENIDAETLQAAVDRVIVRFPSMVVRVRIGMFWYYLEGNPARILVQLDINQPCRHFERIENSGHLLRVLYKGNRLSVEFFHAITDAGGGMVFFKTLIAEYLRLCGVQVPVEDGILDLTEAPHNEETEDAFLRLPVPHTKLGRRESLAYHFPGEIEIPWTLRVIAGSMPVSAVKEKADAISVTITEYVAAAMLYIGYSAQKAEGKKREQPIRVSVPINMRHYFETKTLRNFSWFVNPGIDPGLGDYSFEEIAREVHHFMQQAMTPKRLFAGIATNVSNERNLFMRLVPLPLKDLAINSVYRAFGDRVVTTTLSNLGQIKAPEQMMKHIARFEFLLGASPLPTTNGALITTGDTMVLTFTSNQHDPVLPLKLFEFLTGQGIPVNVEGGTD